MARASFVSNHQGGGIPSLAGNHKDSSPVGFRINYFHAIKEARSSCSNRSGNNLVMGGFSLEADKVQASVLQQSNSQFKSKFFRVSKYSQSRKAAGGCEEVKFDKIEEDLNKSHSETSYLYEEGGSSPEAENNDLGLPPKRQRRWDRKRRTHQREPEAAESPQAVEEVPSPEEDGG